MRRILVALLLALIVSTPSFAAYVQGSKGSNATATTCVTAGITTTSGNLLAFVVATGSGPRTVTGVTDSNGNTWTAASANPQAANGQFNVYVYYAANITGGASHTVTATLNATGLNACAVIELSGRATTTPLIFQGANNEGTASTSHTSAATGVLSESGADLVMMAGDNAQSQAAANETYTATSTGWTLPAAATVSTGATTATVVSMYKENVGTSSETATWTNSAGNLKAASVIFAFKAAAGGGGGTVCNPLSGRCGAAAPPLAMLSANDDEFFLRASR